MKEYHRTALFWKWYRSVDGIPGLIATDVSLVAVHRLINNTNGQVELHLHAVYKMVLFYFRTTHKHTPVYRPFVQDYPGEPVPER